MLLLLRGIRKFPQSFTGRCAPLISSASWSRQNIHCVTGHRLVPYKSNSRIQVGVLLLQSSRGKPPRSPEHSAHARSAACADPIRRQAAKAGPRCLQGTGDEGATLFAIDPEGMPGSPSSAHGFISSDDDLHRRSGRSRSQIAHGFTESAEARGGEIKYSGQDFRDYSNGYRYPHAVRDVPQD